MASPPQLTQVAFAAGLNESQEQELLDPMSAFPVLRNGRQDRRGGYTTRLGFDDEMGVARFDGTSRTSGRRMGVHGRKPWVINGTSFEVYDNGKALWKDAGRVSEVEASTRGMAATTSNLFDVVHCNGFLVSLGWLDASDSSSDAVHAHVETVDGVLIRPSEAVLGVTFSSASQINGCLGTYGNIVLAAFTANNSSSLTLAYLDCTSATTIGSGWTNISTVALPLKVTTGTGAYLIASQSITDRVAFAYINSGAVATSRVTVFTASAAGIISQVNVNTSSVVPSSAGLGGAAGTAVYVAWNETTSVKMIGLVPTTLATSSTTATVISTSGSSGGIHCPYVMETSTGAGHLIVSTSTVNYFRQWTAAAAMAGTGTTPELRSAFLQARPFTRSSRLYGSFRTSQSNANADAVLCDWTDVYTNPWIRPVATVSSGLIQNELAQCYQQPWVIDANTVAIAHAVKQSMSSNWLIQLATYDFSGPDWKSAQVGDTTYIAGGILQAFDGSRLTEAGFIAAPDAPTLGLTGTGLTGTYNYVAVYETIDAAGNLILSGVSLPATVAPSNQSVTVTQPPLNVSMRVTSTYDPNVQISIFRTLAGGEAPYYLLRSIPASPSPSVAFSFTDVTADSTLENRRLLYGTGNLPGTNGAAQDRRAAPYCSDVVAYNGMLVVASGNDIWWSGQIIEGEGAWFSPAFQVPILGTGDIVALSVVDGTLYPMKEDTVWAVAGDAPSDNGSSGGLGTPRLLASDVGCANRMSVVSCGMGVFFESERGIELLQRTGAVRWIGEEVKQTLADYPTVTSAVLDDRNSLVRLSLSDGTDGRDLVYDLSLQTWISVDDKSGSAAEEDSVHACMITVAGTRRYAWLGADGVVWCEHLPADADAHLDGATFIEREAQTAWFKLSGVQGRQFLNSLLVLERYATDHNLEVSLSYNYETGWRSARVFTRAEINALLTAGWPITQLRHDAHDDAECQSVRVRLVQKTPTGGTVGSGKGSSWLALTLDLVPKPGVFDVPEGAV